MGEGRKEGSRDKIDALPLQRLGMTKHKLPLRKRYTQLHAKGGHA